MRLVVALLLSAGFLGSAQAETRLPIPDRAQAAEAPREGWCGESAIQQALLYYGAYVPQRRINRIGGSAHPDLYWSEMPRAMRRLGLHFRHWPADRRLPSLFRWLRSSLRRGNPVLAGVKIHPTEHPRWALDHMVLVVGERRDEFTINTTWGQQVDKSEQQLSRPTGGIAFYNRGRSYHAYAIDGLNKRTPQGVQPRLALEEPVRGKVRATLHFHSLPAGSRYQLHHYRGPNGALVDRRAILHNQKISLLLNRDEPAYFEAVPLR